MPRSGFRLSANGRGMIELSTGFFVGSTKETACLCAREFERTYGFHLNKWRLAVAQKNKTDEIAPKHTALGHHSPYPRRGPTHSEAGPHTRQVVWGKELSLS
jgi:hypothetical protein